MSSRVDVCIAINGPLVDPMLRMCLGSLERLLAQDTSSSRIDLHLVITEGEPERGDPDQNVQIAQSWASKMSVQVHVHRPVLPVALHSPSGLNITRYTDTNTALICEWMVANCGVGEYIVISHFDLLFRENLIRWMVDTADGDANIGMIGAHDPIMLLRRAAYAQTHVGFRNISSMRAYPHHLRDRAGEYRIAIPPVNPEDGWPYQKGGHEGLPIHGFDVGELLQLNVAWCGWRVVPAGSVIESKAMHLRSGSGYHGPGIDDLLRRNVERVLQNEGL